MTDKEIAERFEKLRANYRAHYFVSDTNAFKTFCFINSDRISQILAKAVQDDQ